MMADTASVGILRERKGGEDELTQKRGRSSSKGPDASHSQVVDKGGWDRENSAESLVGEADRGGRGLEISNFVGGSDEFVSDQTR